MTSFCIELGMCLSLIVKTRHYLFMYSTDSLAPISRIQIADLCIKY